MNEANELLNLRAIEITTISALGGDHGQGTAGDGVRQRARKLLQEVRRQTSSAVVRREVDAVEHRLLGVASGGSGAGQSRLGTGDATPSTNAGGE